MSEVKLERLPRKHVCEPAAQQPVNDFMLILRHFHSQEGHAEAAQFPAGASACRDTEIRVEQQGGHVVHAGQDIQPCRAVREGQPDALRVHRALNNPDSAIVHGRDVHLSCDGLKIFDEIPAAKRDQNVAAGVLPAHPL